VVLALLVFVLWKFLSEMLWILLPASRIDVGRARFRLPEDAIHPLRPELAAVGLQYLLILSSLGYFGIPGQAFLWVYAAFCLGASLFMLLFGTMAAGLPTRLDVRTTINLLTLLQMVWLGAAGFQLVSLVHSDFSSFTMPEIRLALVLNAGAFLLIRLTTATSSDHVVGKLMQLRQHIAFGRLSPAEAAKQTEALLNGVAVGEVLAPLVEVIRKEAELLGELVADANRLGEQAREHLRPPAQRPEIAFQLLDQMQSSLDKVHRQVKRIKRAWNRFFVQSVVLGFYSRDSKPEVKAIADSISARFIELGVKVKACFQNHHLLKTEANKVPQLLQNGMAPVAPDGPVAEGSNR
jgi:hypothetical protein